MHVVLAAAFYDLVQIQLICAALQVQPKLKLFIRCGRVELALVDQVGILQPLGPSCCCGCCCCCCCVPAADTTNGILGILVDEGVPVAEAVLHGGHQPVPHPGRFEDVDAVLAQGAGDASRLPPGEKSRPSQDIDEVVCITKFNIIKY